jgi:predicted DNA-binding protein
LTVIPHVPSCGTRYSSFMTSPLPKRIDRRIGARVNLTLPREVDRVLTRLAEAAGTGKASFVREWLVSMTPQLQGMAEALEAAKAGQFYCLTMMAKSLRSAVNGGQQAELKLKKTRAIMRKKMK